MKYLRWSFMVGVSILFPVAAWLIEGWTVDLAYWIGGSSGFCAIVELVIQLTKKKK